MGSILMAPNLMDGETALPWGLAPLAPQVVVRGDGRVTMVSSTLRCGFEAHFGLVDSVLRTPNPQHMNNIGTFTDRLLRL